MITEKSALDGEEYEVVTTPEEREELLAFIAQQAEAVTRATTYKWVV